MAYGGPAIMGIMQAELQEKRRWVDKERFLEGLALVNLLPGAGATQLGIFLGHARGGWWGGLLAGLCFVLPALFIMLGLTVAYAAFGATPLLRGALYGLGPVVLGIYAVAVFRLGKTALAGAPQVLIAVAAALAAAASPLGIATLLALAGGIGIVLFVSRRAGLAVLATIALVTVVSYSLGGTQGLAPDAKVGSGETATGLFDIGVFFFKVGAFTFGGGLTMIAFIQEQVVNQFHWLTPREFVDGLALGQFTPGPILMVAAYVGFKLAGIVGGDFSSFFHPDAVAAAHVGTRAQDRLDEGGDARHRPGGDRRAGRVAHANGAACRTGPVRGRRMRRDSADIAGLARWRHQTDAGRRAAGNFARPSGVTISLFRRMQNP